MHIVSRENSQNQSPMRHNAAVSKADGISLLVDGTVEACSTRFMEDSISFKQGIVFSVLLIGHPRE